VGLGGVFWLCVGYCLVLLEKGGVEWGGEVWCVEGGGFVGGGGVCMLVLCGWGVFGVFENVSLSVGVCVCGFVGGGGGGRVCGVLGGGVVCGCGERGCEGGGVWGWWGLFFVLGVEIIVGGGCWGGELVVVSVACY